MYPWIQGVLSRDDPAVRPTECCVPSEPLLLDKCLTLTIRNSSLFPTSPELACRSMFEPNSPLVLVPEHLRLLRSRTLDGCPRMANVRWWRCRSSLAPVQVREKTDALDAAGNTTAAVGKGFAIGSAALVSLALYGAFVTRLSGPDGVMGGGVNILHPLTFSFLVIGAMLPYW